MSLYNALFGVNPFSNLLLDMLGTTSAKVPRYRDCFLSEDGMEIIIHTRTGGGNRDYYDSEQRCRARYPEYFGEGQEEPNGPWNSDLRAIPGFQYDADDDFDSTYADFHYAIPGAFKEQIAVLRELGASSNPAARWQEMLEKLKTGDKNDPQVKHAMEVGERILGQIKTATEPKV